MSEWACNRNVVESDAYDIWLLGTSWASALIIKEEVKLAHKS